MRLYLLMLMRQCVESVEVQKTEKRAPVMSAARQGVNSPRRGQPCREHAQSVIG